MSNKEIASESLLGERCVEVSRADGIYGYTVFTPLGSKCSCKVYYTTLGCVIWGSRCNLISYKAIHGCYIYHTTVRSRNHGFFSNSSGNLEGSEEVNIHFVHKLLIGYIFGRSNCSGSGVVDKNVDTAVFFHNCINHGINTVCISDVTTYSNSRYIEGFADISCDLVYEVLTTCNSYDGCTLACKSFGHLYAETC